MKKIRLRHSLFASVFAMLLALAFALPALAEEIDITTPKKGIAVAAPENATGTVPLFKTASEDSDVLMEYYSGARLEVVGFSAGGDMAHVQSGVKGASIMGYMRAGDLRYGAYAERVVPMTVNNILLYKDAYVYAYPDMQATIIDGLSTDASFLANSRSDAGWVQCSADTHLLVNRDEKGELGFVHLPVGAAMGNISTWRVQSVDPIEGELSYEEAYERAVELMIEHADEVEEPFFLREYCTREQLLQINTVVRLSCREGNKKGSFTVQWEVEFHNPQRDSSCTVLMEPDGTFAGFEAGNG